MALTFWMAVDSNSDSDARVLTIVISVVVLGFAFLLGRPRKARFQQMSPPKKSAYIRGMTKKRSYDSIFIYGMMVVAAVLVLTKSPYSDQDASPLRAAIFWSVLSLISFFLLVRAFNWVKTAPLRKAEKLASGGNVAGAIDFLRQLIAVSPSADLYAAYASHLSKCDKWEEALQAVDQAELLSGQPDRYLAFRGFLLLKQGKLTDSQAALEKIIRYQPGNLAAICHLGCVLAELNRVDDAKSRQQTVGHQLANPNAVRHELRAEDEAAYELLSQKIADADSRQVDLTPSPGGVASSPPPSVQVKNEEQGK